MRSTACLAATSVLSLMSSPAMAEDEQEPAPKFRYLAAARLQYQPEYAGAQRYEFKLRPVWALQWGRWRISTSGGNGLLGFGGEVRGDGASTELVRSDRLKLGLSFRVDSGRSSGDASTTAGLPDVRRTLRGRVYAGYALTPDWQLSGSLSQDLLGRHGGLTAGLDLSWRLKRTADFEWTAGGGISAGDATNMRSYFGVTPEGSTATGLPVYTPSAGLRDAHAGTGWTWQLSPRWIAFGSAGVAQQMGPAADSPLTQRRFGGSLAVGLAYRN
ncbi:MipA/OmpV family protein [Paucibacter sp. R3-3]|uniref:MipA/OmpV family protein n=1 Tax=Roseateles agri TaxID=3098619 RepID=A0ABU5DP19_9BURK|nr:MipA/OmpV family protein [Paucibacter sp. R3-3]MDY0747483.1 MipA/OmpV family protein [Paucibacter sp. R3-3]